MAIFRPSFFQPLYSKPQWLPSAPAAAATQTITPGFIASTEAVSDPVQLSLSISAGFIASTEQVFAPQLNLTIYPGFIATTESVFAPQLNLTVAPGFIASTEQVFDPTQIALTIFPGLISTAEQVFTPSIAVGAVSILPGFIASSEQVFDPAVSSGAVTLTPGFIASTEQVFAPTVGLSIAPGFIASTEQVFDPAQLTLSISIPFIASQEQVFDPGVSGPQVISPGLIASEEAVFTPSLHGGVQTLVIGFISFDGNVFQPQVYRFANLPTIPKTTPAQKKAAAARKAGLNPAKERFKAAAGTDPIEKTPLPKIPRLPVALKTRYPELEEYERDWERYQRELKTIQEKVDAP